MSVILFLRILTTGLLAASGILGVSTRSAHPSKKLPTDCGESMGDRIANGTVTKVFDYPWMAILRYRELDGGYIDTCGGSLINKRYVLTAAHCIKTLSVHTLEYVRLGEHNKGTELDCKIRKALDGTVIEQDCAEPFEDYKVNKTEIHPYYNRPRYSNDIGLIRLDRDVTFNDHIQPICLPVTPELQAQTFTRYILTGWGKTENQVGSDVLLEASLPLVSNEVCRQNIDKYRLDIQLSEKQMCVGGENTTDACKGDSGGPLGINTNYNGPRFVQYGVVASGAPACGDRNGPGLYTRVASYMGWILENITE